MASATVTSKGQITIPAEIRKRLKLNAGDRLDFIENGSSGRFEIVAANVPLVSLLGILPKPERPVTIEEMNETTRKGWAGLL